MKGTLCIKNLIAPVQLGVTDDERSKVQSIIINVNLLLDVTEAIMHDKVELTIDYFSLGENIVTSIRATSFNLIESLANCIADICLKNKRVLKVEIQIEKPHIIPKCESAGFTLIKFKYD